jgi:hypothetical protein
MVEFLSVSRASAMADSELLLTINIGLQLQFGKCNAALEFAFYFCNRL